MNEITERIIEELAGNLLTDSKGEKPLQVNVRKRIETEERILIQKILRRAKEYLLRDELKLNVKL